jgi:hypothetical protein
MNKDLQIVFMSLLLAGVWLALLLIGGNDK